MCASAGWGLDTSGPDAPNGVEVSVDRRADSDVRVRLGVVRAGAAPGEPDQRRLPGGVRGRGGPCGSDSRVAPRAEAPVVLPGAGMLSLGDEAGLAARSRKGR